MWTDVGRFVAQNLRRWSVTLRGEGFFPGKLFTNGDFPQKKIDASNQKFNFLKASPVAALKTEEITGISVRSLSGLWTIMTLKIP